jgi:eukaryotic-like serine/threonine-protein kinase
MTIPATLGKFDILKTLGKGGMGTVYLGYDKKLHRHVAIKTIHRDDLVSDEISSEYARRFELEAKAIAKLNHPNIVNVYDSGEEGDTAYLVMEFVEGHDLKYYFDKQLIFSLAEVMRLMGELLEALAHAHDKGVWHRDIKPANVMIDINGQVKLTDFGVSRIADSNDHRTRMGTMVGTLYYMSPRYFCRWRDFV